MTLPSNDRSPSKLWYIGHLFFWIISGLICYLVWKDENPQAAKKHLIHSIWLSFIGFFVSFAILFIFGAIMGQFHQSTLNPDWSQR